MFDTYELHIGKQIDWRQLQELLQEYGYVRVGAIGERGDYAIRGGVLDLFLPVFEAPLRFEFSDNTVESIQTFKPSEKRWVWVIQRTWNWKYLPKLGKKIDIGGTQIRL